MTCCGARRSRWLPSSGKAARAHAPCTHTRRRCVREVASYEEEVRRERDKHLAMPPTACPHDAALQGRVVEESRDMLCRCQAGLGGLCDDLAAFIVSATVWCDKKVCSRHA